MIKIGDIFKLEAQKKKIYIQYVLEVIDSTQTEKVKVFYDLYDKAPRLSDIVEGDYFFLELPIKGLARSGKIVLVGNLSLPECFSYPKNFRSENPFGKGWAIINSEGGREVVKELSDEQMKMSPWGIWSLELLKEKLLNGWRLENWR